MELTSQLTQEDDYVVWYTALSRFSDLVTLIELEDYFGIFQVKKIPAKNLYIGFHIAVVA